MQCRIATCTEPATHILVTDRHTWIRVPMLPKDAPDCADCTSYTGAPVGRRLQTPYYCAEHATERAQPHPAPLPDTPSVVQVTKGKKTGKAA